MTPQKFLSQACFAAVAVGHPFPEYVACEAAEESTDRTNADDWKLSHLALDDNNLFGMKQHQHPVYGTHNLPTREFVGKVKDTEDGLCDGWVSVVAHFVHYPDWPSCFKDRLDTLKRLAPLTGFEHYANALKAPDGETYVREVSAKWSTDPKRALGVLAIYRRFMLPIKASLVMVPDLDGEISV